MKKTYLFSLVMGLFLAGCGGGNGQAASESHDTVASVASGEQQAGDGKGGVLNLYIWSDYSDPATITEFEKQTGIKVRQDFYDSNETLEAKVLTGNSGYDLVVPSLANVGRQITAGAYQPIDKSQISNYSNIDPGLLKLMDQVDPGNKYAVPYFWGINTLAINKDLVQKALGTDKLPENEWDLVFNPEYTSKLQSCGISFFDSPLEQYPLALQYIGKDPNSANTDDLKAATDMMQKVRPNIKRFTNSGYIDDLARGDLCVAIGYGGDLNIAKTRANDAKNGINIEVLVPKQGVAMWVDSFMIPKDAQNVANALKYINYTLEPKVAAANGNYVTYAPASLSARELMEPEYRNDPSIFPSEEVRANSYVILPKSGETSRVMTRLYQGLMTAK